MMARRALPDRSELVDFNYAVAGHAGTMCDSNGELFIKPCTQAELDFYQSAIDEHPAFSDLMPIFMGSLTLNDVTDPASATEHLPTATAAHLPEEIKEQLVEFVAHQAAPQDPAAPTSAPPRTEAAPRASKDTWLPNASRRIATNSAVVLENAAHGYKHPNIVDVKLGTRLWADDAPAEKKTRFDKIASETTHKDLGFRIAGMRVYKGSPDEEQLDAEGYRIYNKDYGRYDVNKDNVIESFRHFIFNRSAGIDEDVGRAVAHAFKRDLENVQDVLEKEESRMYSSSLLFVFEGDGAALSAAVNEESASAASSAPDAIATVAEGPVSVKGDYSIVPRSTLRVDSGIDMDEEGEMIVKGDGVDISALGTTRAIGTVDEIMAAGLSSEPEEEEREEPHIYTLKLIDFAHAQWTPGQGPDENVLLGVRSLIKIFEELSK